MLQFFRGKASDRKLRLFVCACCSQSGSLMSSDGGKEAIEAVEGWADGWLTEADVLARVGRLNVRDDIDEDYSRIALATALRAEDAWAGAQHATTWALIGDETPSGPVQIRGAEWTGSIERL